MSSTTAQKIVGSSLFFWLFVGAFCIWYIWPLRENLRFGIDLVGGTYITLEVHTDKAIEAQLVDLMQKFKKQFKKANLAKPLSSEVKPVFAKENAQTPDSYVLVYSFNSGAEAQVAADFIKEQHRTMDVTVAGSDLNVRYSAAEEKRIQKDAVERNIEVIRTRIDRLGVSETPITRQGDRHIIIELPDVSDPQKAKAIIGKAAVLEFKLVEKFGRTEDELLYEYDGDLPYDLEILPGKMERGEVPGYYAVSRYADLTGKLLAKVNPTLLQDKAYEWVIEFAWNPEGAEKFYELTSKNHGKHLAIVLDGVVISAPVIKTSIRETGSISGGYIGEEGGKSAKELALLLKSGSFVAPITFEEERQVGPSLGAESIRDGVLSCLFGLGLILMFSLFYYKGAGLFASLALIFNLILILFGMARVGATLTLPGIAGMVLTIGMAIDASILIYERIKEELRSGKKIREAVDLGFSNAREVILDSNITTFIVGAVLYSYGTGPIKGFAVTLMLGIVATLIAGLFFLRSIFTFILNNFNVQKLSI